MGHPKSKSDSLKRFLETFRHTFEGKFSEMEKSIYHKVLYNMQLGKIAMILKVCLMCAVCVT